MSTTQHVAGRVHQKDQRYPQHASERQGRAQARFASALHGVHQLPRQPRDGAQLAWCHTQGDASIPKKLGSLSADQPLAPSAKTTRLKSPGHNADNVAVAAMTRKSTKKCATLPSQADKRPGKMDYDKLRGQTAPSSPESNTPGNKVQANISLHGARNRSESLMVPDPTVKELTAVRRQIHNRLNRVDRLRDLLATLEAGIDALELRERQLVFQLWSDSPSRLEQLNRDHRRWRSRKPR